MDFGAYDAASKHRCISCQLLVEVKPDLALHSAVVVAAWAWRERHE